MYADAKMKEPRSPLLLPPSANLKQLFLKLRWMGLDREAEDLSRLLAPDEALVGTIDTD